MTRTCRVCGRRLQWSCLAVGAAWYVWTASKALVFIYAATWAVSVLAWEWGT